MGIWVRSQRKRHLIKIEHLCVFNSDIICYVNGEAIILGGYCSNVRCLEILNEIQALIANGNPYYIPIIYQMPEK